MEGKAAQLPPGSNGVVGMFSNVMQASRWVHTSPGFLGFDVAQPRARGRVECFRAIEEAPPTSPSPTCASSRSSRAMHPAERRCSPGGAAKGTCGRRSSPTRSASPLHIPVVKESTALGAAICAGVGAGFWTTPTTGGRAPSPVRAHRSSPTRAAAAAYRELYDHWQKIYRRSMELAEPGLVRPLWRAAGT